MDRESISKFVERLGITIESKRRPATAKEMNDKWSRTAHHWTVTLSYQGRKLVTPWSAGQAITEAPAAGQVLISFKLDISAYKESKDWRDFVKEYGGDKNTYECCRREHEKLVDLLGEELTTHLLSHVEEDEDME